MPLLTFPNRCHLSSPTFECPKHPTSSSAPRSTVRWSRLGTTPSLCGQRGPGKCTSRWHLTWSPNSLGCSNDRLSIFRRGWLRWRHKRRLSWLTRMDQTSWVRWVPMKRMRKSRLSIRWQRWWEQSCRGRWAGAGQRRLGWRDCPKIRICSRRRWWRSWRTGTCWRSSCQDCRTQLTTSWHTDQRARFLCGRVQFHRGKCQTCHHKSSSSLG